MGNNKYYDVPMRILEKDGLTIHRWPWIEGIEIDKDGATIYYCNWEKNNPIRLWVWQNGPEITRIDMRGLEQFPPMEQLKPALAILANMREQERRKTGDLAGTGRNEKKEWIEIYNQWESSGFNPDTRRELLQSYLIKCKKTKAYKTGEDDEGKVVERFDRTMRRYKQKRTKTE